MRIALLRAFVSVGEERQFGRAANRMNLTQPALSRQIAQLENILGLHVFERQAKGVELTDAGKVFFDDARRIVREFDEACVRAKRIGCGLTGTLRLAFNEVAARRPELPLIIQAFRNAHETVEVKLLTMTSQDQGEALATGDIDVGFLFFLPDEPAFVTKKIRDEELVIALPASHRLASKKIIRVRDLATERLIWPSRVKNRILIALLEAAFLKAGIAPQVVQDADIEHQTLGLVSVGMGIGLVLRPAIKDFGSEIVVRPLSDLNLPISFKMAWNRQRVTPILKKFLASAETTMAAHGW